MMTRDKNYTIAPPPPGYTSIIRRIPRLPANERDQESRAAAARAYLHDTDTQLTEEQIESLILKSLLTRDDHLLMVAHLPHEDR